MTDTTLSRRHLLAGVSATTAAAAAGLVGSARPAAAKAPLVKTQAPAFYRFNVGSVEATVVSDGLIVAVPKDTFVGPAATDVEKMILKYTAESGADIVFVNSGRGIGDVKRDVIRRIGTPVMIVPAARPAGG